MLSFAKFRQKFDIFDTAVFCALYAIRAGVFSKEFLLTLVLYLYFAIRTGVFSKEFLLTPVLYLCFAIRTGVFQRNSC